MISTKEAAEKWKISDKKVKAMAQYIEGAFECPCCNNWILPDDSMQVYIPDRRHYGKSSLKNYTFILDAIAGRKKIVCELLFLDEVTLRTIVRELNKNGLLIILDGRDENSLEYTDYWIALQYGDWLNKSNQEKLRIVNDFVAALTAGIVKGTLEAKT